MPPIQPASLALRLQAALTSGNVAQIASGAMFTEGASDRPDWFAVASKPRQFLTPITDFGQGAAGLFGEAEQFGL